MVVARLEKRVPRGERGEEMVVLAKARRARWIEGSCIMKLLARDLVVDVGKLEFKGLRR